MFNWIRDKTTTAYNNIPDGESPIISGSRPQTTSNVSHQKQYGNGREGFLFMILIEIDQLYFV